MSTSADLSAAMTRARELAAQAALDGEVPVAALILAPEGIIAEASNRVERWQDPLAHAEMLALGLAQRRRGTRYLSDCTLLVTLEPCALCAAAIAAYRLKRLVFGAYDPKSGGVESGARVLDYSHHQPKVIGGLQERACAALLQDFFAERRQSELRE